MHFVLPVNSQCPSITISHGCQQPVYVKAPTQFSVCVCLCKPYVSLHIMTMMEMLKTLYYIIHCKLMLCVCLLWAIGAMDEDWNSEYVCWQW